MKRLVANRYVHPVLAIAVAGLSGAGCGGSSGNGTGPMPEAGMVRLLNASPLASGLDVYIHGEAQPILSNVAYGTTSAQAMVPAGMVQLDLRVAGAPAAAAPSLVSDAVAVTSSGAITVVAAGLLGSTQPGNAFRVTSVDDAFAPAASGKARIRVVNAMYALDTVDVAVASGGSATQIAALARFTVSEPAGIEVGSGIDLALGVTTSDATHGRIASFAVPGTALTAGANVYVVIAGLSSFAPRNPHGMVALVSPPAGSDTVVVKPDPVVYLLAASPDAGSIDGVLAGNRLFAGLAFGKVGSSAVPATTSGHMLDIHAAGADAVMASLSTGALDAGQQYLAVLTGVVNPASAGDALALRVFRDDMNDSNDTGRLRIVNASVGAGMVDAGRYAVNGPLVWQDMPDFDALPSGAASPAAGTPVAPGTIPTPTVLGARPSATPDQALHFDTLPGLNANDRFFAVLAGAWLPSGAQAGPQYIIVKTAAVNPWTTSLLPALPDALAVTPGEVTVTLGGKQQFQARTVFGNGISQDVTASATWTANDASIAGVSTAQRGEVSALALGDATITAELAGATGAATLHVTPQQILAVSSVQPTDATTGVGLDAHVTVGFSLPVDPATLVTQVAAGACTGTLQLSTDGFASCVGFASATPQLDASGTLATAAPSVQLAGQTTFRIRVTAGVASLSGVALGADVAQGTGFRTTCAGKLVISELNGGGGITGGVFSNDFVELHNSGNWPIDLSSYVLQFAAVAGGSIWTAAPLPAMTLEPGHYFLIAGASGGVMLTDLPAADFTPDPEMPLNGNNGKLVLTRSATPLTVGCPVLPDANVVDIVGYGTGSCFETMAVPRLTNPTAALRNGDGCTDTDSNSADFAVVTLTATTPPRNTQSTPKLCACN